MSALIKPLNQTRNFNAWSSIINKARLSPYYNSEAYNDLSLTDRELYTTVLAKNSKALSERIPTSVYNSASASDKLALLLNADMYDNMYNDAYNNAYNEYAADNVAPTRESVLSSAGYGGLFDSDLLSPVIQEIANLGSVEAFKEKYSQEEFVKSFFSDSTLSLPEKYFSDIYNKLDTLETDYAAAVETHTQNAKNYAADKAGQAWSNLLSAVINNTNERLKAEAYANANDWEKFWQTTLSIVSAPVSAVGNMLEGLVDAVASFIPGSDEFVKTDIIPLDTIISENLPYSLATSQYADGFLADACQIIYGVVDSVTKLGVSTGINILTGGTLGTVMYYTSMYGSSTEEGLNDGMNWWQARLYGIGATAVEWATEHISSDAFLGKTSWFKRLDTWATKSAGCRIVHDVIGEGLEEVVSGFFQGSIKAAILDESWWEHIKKQELGKAFLSGALLGAIGSIGGSIKQAKANNKVINLAQGSNGEMFEVSFMQRHYVESFIENMEKAMTVKGLDGKSTLDSKRISDKNYQRYQKLKALSFFEATDNNEERATRRSLRRKKYNTIVTDKSQFEFLKPTTEASAIDSINAAADEIDKAKLDESDFAPETNVKPTEAEIAEGASLATKLLAYQLVQSGTKFGESAVAAGLEQYNRYIENELDKVIETSELQTVKTPTAKIAQKVAIDNIGADDITIVSNNSIDELRARMKTAESLKSKFVYVFHTSDDSVPGIFVVGKRVYIRDNLAERFTSDAIIDNVLAAVIADDIASMRLTGKIESMLGRIIRKQESDISESVQKQQLLMLLLYNTNNLYYKVFHMSKEQMAEIRAYLQQKISQTKHVHEYKVLSSAITAYDNTIVNSVATTEDAKIAENMVVRPEAVDNIQVDSTASPSRAYNPWYHGQFSLATDINEHAADMAQLIDEFTSDFGFSVNSKLSLIEKIKALYDARNYSPAGYTALQNALKSFEHQLLLNNKIKYDVSNNFHFRTALSVYLGDRCGIYLINNQVVTLLDIEDILDEAYLDEVILATNEINVTSDVELQIPLSKFIKGTNIPAATLEGLTITFKNSSTPGTAMGIALGTDSTQSNIIIFLDRIKSNNLLYRRNYSLKEIVIHEIGHALSKISGIDLVTIPCHICQAVMSGIANSEESIDTIKNKLVAAFLDNELQAVRNIPEDTLNKFATELIALSKQGSNTTAKALALLRKYQDIDTIFYTIFSVDEHIADNQTVLDKYAIEYDTVKTKDGIVRKAICRNDNPLYEFINGSTVTAIPNAETLKTWLTTAPSRKNFLNAFACLKSYITTINGKNQVVEFASMPRNAVLPGCMSIDDLRKALAIEDSEPDAVLTNASFWQKLYEGKHAYFPVDKIEMVIYFYTGCVYNEKTGEYEKAEKVPGFVKPLEDLRAKMYQVPTNMTLGKFVAEGNPIMDFDTFISDGFVMNKAEIIDWLSTAIKPSGDINFDTFMKHMLATGKRGISGNNNYLYDTCFILPNGELVNLDFSIKHILKVQELHSIPNDTLGKFKLQYIDNSLVATNIEGSNETIAQRLDAMNIVRVKKIDGEWVSFGKSNRAQKNTLNTFENIQLGNNLAEMRKVAPVSGNLTPAQQWRVNFTDILKKQGIIGKEALLNFGLSDSFVNAMYSERGLTLSHLLDEVNNSNTPTYIRNLIIQSNPRWANNANIKSVEDVNNFIDIMGSSLGFAISKTGLTFNSYYDVLTSQDLQEFDAKIMISGKLQAELNATLDRIEKFNSITGTSAIVTGLLNMDANANMNFSADSYALYISAIQNKAFSGTAINRNEEITSIYGETDKGVKFTDLLGSEDSGFERVENEEPILDDLTTEKLETKLNEIRRNPNIEYRVNAYRDIANSYKLDLTDDSNVISRVLKEAFRDEYSKYTTGLSLAGNKLKDRLEKIRQLGEKNPESPEFKKLSDEARNEFVSLRNSSTLTRITDSDYSDMRKVYTAYGYSLPENTQSRISKTLKRREVEISQMTDTEAKNSANAQLNVIKSIHKRLCLVSLTADQLHECRQLFADALFAWNKDVSVTVKNLNTIEEYLEKSTSAAYAEERLVPEDRLYYKQFMANKQKLVDAYGRRDGLMKYAALLDKVLTAKVDQISGRLYTVLFNEMSRIEGEFSAEPTADIVDNTAIPASEFRVSFDELMADLDVSDLGINKDDLIETAKSVPRDVTSARIREAKQDIKAEKAGHTYTAGVYKNRFDKLKALENSPAVTDEEISTTLKDIYQQIIKARLPLPKIISKEDFILNYMYVSHSLARLEGIAGQAISNPKNPDEFDAAIINFIQEDYTNTASTWSYAGDNEKIKNWRRELKATKNTLQSICWQLNELFGDKLPPEVKDIVLSMLQESYIVENNKLNPFNVSHYKHLLTLSSVLQEYVSTLKTADLKTIGENILKREIANIKARKSYSGVKKERKIAEAKALYADIPKAIKSVNTIRQNIVNEILEYYSARYDANEILNKASIPLERWPGDIKYTRLGFIANALADFEYLPKTKASLDRLKGLVYLGLKGDTDNKSIRHEVAYKDKSQQAYGSNRMGQTKRRIEYTAKAIREALDAGFTDMSLDDYKEIKKQYIELSKDKDKLTAQILADKLKDIVAKIPENSNELNALQQFAIDVADKFMNITDANPWDNDWRETGSTIMKALFAFRAGKFNHFENRMTTEKQFMQYYEENAEYLKKVEEKEAELTQLRKDLSVIDKINDFNERVAKASEDELKRLARSNGFNEWQDFLDVRAEYAKLLGITDTFKISGISPSELRKAIVTIAEEADTITGELSELQKMAMTVRDNLKTNLGELAWNNLFNRVYVAPGEGKKKTPKRRRVSQSKSTSLADNDDFNDVEETTADDEADFNDEEDIDTTNADDEDDFEDEDFDVTDNAIVGRAYELRKVPNNLNSELARAIESDINILKASNTADRTLLSETFNDVGMEDTLTKLNNRIFDTLTADEQDIPDTQVVSLESRIYDDVFNVNPFKPDNTAESTETKNDATTEKQTAPAKPVNKKREPIYAEPSRKSRLTVKSKLLTKGIQKMLSYQFDTTTETKAYSGNEETNFERHELRSKQFIFDEATNIQNMLSDSTAVNNFIEWFEKTPNLDTQEEAISLILLDNIRMSLLVSEDIRKRAGDIIAQRRSQYASLLALNGRLAATPLDTITEIAAKYMDLSDAEKEALTKASTTIRKAYAARNFKMADTVMESALSILAKHSSQLPVKYNVFEKNISKAQRAGRMKNLLGTIEAFRYTAMLSNPSTFLMKNYLGNVMASGLDKVSTAIGNMLSRYEGSTERYSLSWGKTSEDAKTAKTKMAENLVKRDLVDSGLLETITAGSATRYKDTNYHPSKIRKIPNTDDLSPEDIRAIDGMLNPDKPFGKAKVLNKIHNFIFSVMEKVDKKFVNNNIIKRTTELMAKNWTTEQMQALQDGSAKAIQDFDNLVEYVTNDTLTTFFRNSPAAYKALLKLFDKHPMIQAVIKLTFPFLRMTINSASTVLAYSPIGAIQTFSKWMTGKFEGPFASLQMRKAYAKSVTGSLLMVLGAILAKIGWLRLEEDKEYLGPQLVIANTLAINLSDLSPSTTSLTVGATLVLSEGNSFGDSMAAAANSFLEAALVGDLISWFGNKSASEIVAYPFQQYTYQLIPAVFKSITRAIDPAAKNTSGSWLKKIASYLPGISFAVDNKIDSYTGEAKGVYGQHDGFGAILGLLNAISPFKLYDVSTTDVEEESIRVDAATNGPASSFTQNGKVIEVPEDKLQAYKILRAKLYNEYATAIIHTDSYKRKSDADKRKILKSLQNKATMNARKQLNIK